MGEGRGRRAGRARPRRAEVEGARERLLEERGGAGGVAGDEPDADEAVDADRPGGGAEDVASDTGACEGDEERREGEGEGEADHARGGVGDLAEDRRDLLGLEERAEAECGEGEGEGEEEAEERAGAVAEPRFDRAHRRRHHRAAAIVAAESGRQRGVEPGEAHPEEGGDPHPREGPSAAEAHRQRAAGDAGDPDAADGRRETDEGRARVGERLREPADLRHEGERGDDETGAQDDVDEGHAERAGGVEDRGHVA